MEKSQTLNRPFTCYFCNKTIKNETQMGHTTVCGSVLLPCPIKCGSYVRRIDFKRHQMECPSRTQKNNVKILTESECSETDTSSGGTLTRRRVSCIVHQEPPNHRLSMPPSPSSRRSSGSGAGPSPTPLQEIRQCRAVQAFQQQQLETLRMQQGQLEGWRRDVQTRVALLQEHLASHDTFRKETGIHWMTAQQKFMQTDKLQMEMDRVKADLAQEQAYVRKCLNSARKVELMADEFNALRTSDLDQMARSEAIAVDVRRMDDITAEVRAKLANLVFDVRAVSQIASEATEKLEIQERTYRELKTEFVQLRADVQAVEEFVAAQGNITKCCSSGHLLWKITDCDAKMEEAKSKGTVVKSPIFYTHDHGYKVRLLLYLNGLNKWKDRYALFCLHVLKGDYDMLLKWPSNIEGVVTLRDLENLDDAKNFTKKITARRRVGGEETEDPQESSPSYIFIPHATMLKSKYVKEDTMFIEVKIDKQFLQ